MQAFVRFPPIQKGASAGGESQEQFGHQGLLKPDHPAFVIFRTR